MRKTTQQLAITADALDVTGPHKPISSVSDWGDPTWKLDGGRPGSSAGSVTVYWPELTDPHLLESFKRLIWSMYVAPYDRAPPSVGTIVAMGWGVKILAKWMDEEAYDFSHVDRNFGKALQAHLRECATRNCPDEYGFDADEESDALVEGSEADDVMSFGAVTACAGAASAIYPSWPPPINRSPPEAGIERHGDMTATR